MPSIQLMETYNLSDKEVNILRYLQEHSHYTWYPGDHRKEHPFTEHDADSLKFNGFVSRNFDHNFGDVSLYLTHKGERLLAALNEQEGEDNEES